LPVPGDWAYVDGGITAEDDWEAPVAFAASQTGLQQKADAVSYEDINIQIGVSSFVYQKITWTFLTNRMDPSEHAIVAKHVGDAAMLQSAPSAISTTVALIGPGQAWWQSLNPGKIRSMQYEPHKNILVVVAENGIAVIDLWDISRRWSDNGYNPVSFDQSQGHFKWYPNVVLFGTGRQFAGLRLDWINDWILVVTRGISNTNRYDLAIVDMDTFHLGANGARVNGPRFFPPVHLNPTCNATTCMRGPWWWYFNPWFKVVQFYRLDGKLVTQQLWPWPSRSPDASNPYAPADLPEAILTDLAAPPLVVSDVISPTAPPAANLHLLHYGDEGMVGVWAPPGSVEPYATVHVLNTTAVSLTLAALSRSLVSPAPEFSVNTHRLDPYKNIIGAPDGSFGRRMQMTHGPASVDPDTLFVGAEPGDVLEVTVCDVAGNCSAPVTVTVPNDMYLPIIAR
jgi:hypothetical protein